MKKIILGIDSWYPLVDGGTNVVLNYDKLLNKINKSIVIAPSFGKEADKEGEEKYHKNVFHTKSDKMAFGNFYSATPWRDKNLKKYLNEYKPDVMHIHSPFYMMRFFTRYGKKHKIPVIYTFHTKFKDDIFRFTHSHFLTALTMIFVMYNINRVDYVWAVSKHAADVLRSYGYKKPIRIVYNSTDMHKVVDEEINQLAKVINKRYRISPNEKILLYIGRIVKNKNIDFSLKVIKELKNRNVKCKFLLVGKGDIDRYRKLVKKLEIEDCVQFVGPVYDRKLIGAFYSRAHLFMLPSNFDMHSLVPLEAAAYKTPTIAPTKTSFDETIENNRTGYLRDLDVKLWADCIQQSFTDDLYKQIKKNCQELVVNWDSRTEEIDHLYDEVIADYKAKHKKK